jgi:hypothetical protein
MVTVERIMLLKLQASAEREAIARLSRDVLAALPQLLELSVGLPSDEASSRSWDVSLIMRFATQADVDAALESSIFRHYVEVDLGGKVQVVKAWSFARLSA